jgi:hypothetical protein
MQKKSWIANSACPQKLHFSDHSFIQRQIIQIPTVPQWEVGAPTNRNEKEGEQDSNKW